MKKFSAIITLLMLLVLIPVQQAISYEGGEIVQKVDVINEDNLKNLSVEIVERLNKYLKNYKNPVLYVTQFINRSDANIDLNSFSSELYSMLQTTDGKKTVEYFDPQSKKETVNSKLEYSNYFYLKGNMKSIESYNKGREITYYILQIKIIDAETTVVQFQKQIWMTKKDGKVTVSYDSDDILKKSVNTKYWGACDAISAAQYLSKSLNDFFAENPEERYRFSIQKVRNRTSENINSSIIIDEIESRILKKSENCMLIDEPIKETVLNDIQKNKIKPGHVKSPDFLINGSIRESSRMIKGKQRFSIVISMKLFKSKQE